MALRVRQFGLVASAAAMALALACRDPTEMMLRITTNAPCAQLDVTIDVGAAGEAPSGVAAGQKGCHDAAAVPAYVGSIVLVPSERDVSLTVRVMGGVGRTASSCIDAFGPGCIVARRTLRYITHATLNLPIMLDTQCDGLACSESSTCVLGKCVDSTIDPNGCLVPGGCGGSLQVAHVSAKGGTTCAVFTDGSVRCWGRNDVGQLGFSGSPACGSVPCERKPVLVPSVPSAKVVAVGDKHACAVTSTAGEVWCWGDSTSAQTSVTGASTPPVKVAGLAGMTNLGAGARHTCAVGTPGNPATTSNVFCWGDNGSGQLGIGVASGPSAQPKNVPGQGTYGLVVAGDDFTCGALASKSPSSGELYCWGARETCQTGKCDPSPDLLPVYNTNACDGMAAAGKHMLLYGDFGAGITTCWGDDGAGQTSGTPGPPKSMASSIGFLTSGVGAGRNHTCAILTGGVVRCWGDNSKGQRGTGSTPFVDTTLPAAAEELALGDTHTCALAADGKIYCWGDGSLGQLGDGALSVRPNALPVEW
jgi:hypothetical protein